MTIKDALRNLISAIGGTPAKSKNLASMINAVAEGGGVYKISLTQDDTGVHTDKTFKQIYDAMTAGKFPVGMQVGEGNIQILQFTEGQTFDNGDAVEYLLTGTFGSTQFFLEGTADEVLNLATSGSGGSD